MYVKISCKVRVACLYLKIVYTLRIASYIISLIIWSQWCKERVIVHFTFH